LFNATHRGAVVAYQSATMYGMNQTYNVPQDPSAQVPNQLVSARPFYDFAM
jgi:hypothetical protein